MALRDVARNPGADAVGMLDADGRIFQPPDGLIRVEPRSNSRASCRCCGDAIAEGVDAVVFGFASLPGGVGHVIVAYVHADPCPLPEVL